MFNHRIFSIILILFWCVGCNSDDQTSSEMNDDIEREVLDYPSPNDEINTILRNPYVYPEQICIDVPEGREIDEKWLTQGELCYWNNAQGCMPPGEVFSEWVSCDEPMTTSAGFYKFPGPKVNTDQSVLNDPEWQKESEWVLEEIRACG